MNKDLIELLACPKDGFYPLQLQAEIGVGEKVTEGMLLCPSCGSQFKIIAGIPKFLSLDSDQISDIKLREMEARDQSYRAGTESYELELERFGELDALRSAIGNCKGLRVLDAGCGAGQTTRVAYDASQVVGIDFAWEGLTKFKFHGSSTIDLVRGDVSQMPFRGNLFDVSVSSQVLEHIPSKELRMAFLAQISRTMKPGGRLAITTYNWDQNRQERGIPKEGLHDSGIFYHCYDHEEFRNELAKNFEVEGIWGVEIFLPKTYRLVKALGKNYVHWDRFWRTKHISLFYSKLLLGICRSRR